MENLGCPCVRIPLGVAGMLQKKGNPIHLVPIPLQKLPEECQFDHRSAFGASLRFFLWVDFLSLVYPLGDHKAVVLFHP